VTLRIDVDKITLELDLGVLLGTKYFGRHFSVTSKQINVNQALTSSQ
jgi:hypothetical protein